MEEAVHTDALNNGIVENGISVLVDGKEELVLTIMNVVQYMINLKQSEDVFL